MTVHQPLARVPRTRRVASESASVPDDLLLSMDENGSLVTVPPAEWIVCFVPGLKKQWWHKFVNGRHKHCYAMRPTGTGSWVLVEPWWTRLMVTVLPSTDAVRFLRWGAAGDMLRITEAVPGKGNQLRGWSNCAVLMSFLLGGRAGPIRRTASTASSRARAARARWMSRNSWSSNSRPSSTMG